MLFEGLDSDDIIGLFHFGKTSTQESINYECPSKSITFSTDFKPQF